MIAFGYRGVTKENLVSPDEDFLFKKEIAGTVGNVSYKKDDRIIRFLFGAFVSYFKYQIIPDALRDGKIGLRVINATSGFSSGRIGRDQVTQEIIDIKAGLPAI